VSIRVYLWKNNRPILTWFDKETEADRTMMDWLMDPRVWIGLLTLTALEIVLGIDNIVFISILVGKLPLSQRQRARTIGLALAMGMRILLLLSLSWIIGLTEPLFSLFPTIKMLALSFLLLIGTMLIAEGFGHHIPKGYIYFAMAFSVFVEMLNLRMRSRSDPPVHLRENL
jgi:predicted tellurium resistance membrane protein TerC